MPNWPCDVTPLKPDPSNFCVPFHESRCKTPPIIPRPCRSAGHSIAADRGLIIPSDAPVALWKRPTIHPASSHLPRRHGLGDQPLKSKLLLLEVLSRRVLNLELAHGLAERLLDLVLLAALELEGESRVGDDLLNTGDVRLELLLGLEAFAESLVLSLELLRICTLLVNCSWRRYSWIHVRTVDHVLNLARRELANRVGDGDVGAAARGLLGGGDLEDTVDVDLEDDLKDGLAGLHGRDGGKGEFTQRSVVLAVDALTLEHGELHGLLVVGNSGEGPLLDGGDGLATGNDRGEDVTLHGNTQGQGNDVQEEEVGGVGGSGLAGEDTGLDGGTVGDGLIGVDALLELLAVEELAEELLDAGDTGGATDKDDLINARLLDAGILENLGNRLEGAGESLGVQVLETSTSDLHVEILAVEERVDLDGGLSTARQSTLGALAGRPQPPEGTGITREI